jgi:cell wall-associated NlpC family hydrolase
VERGSGRPSGGASAGQGAAGKAIAFAREQLGEPYVWAAAGPGSWDCSGLTMGAWQQAGVRLPHYSVAQYERVGKIAEDELRPGDLIFWADSPDDPATIFHVALYLGDGEMIHAPRAGQPVKVENVYYWETPDFFGRP